VTHSWLNQLPFLPEHAPVKNITLVPVHSLQNGGWVELKAVAGLSISF